MNGKLGINNREYYESKAKRAEERREDNKRLIKGYYDSLVREIDAALFGIADHEKFVVAVDTVFEATRKGFITRFKTYSFDLHPPAVSSNGKILARKKSRNIFLIGPTAKELYERMVDECTKEFGLRNRYYQDKNSLSQELKPIVDRETGIIIIDKFYPVAIEKKGGNQLTFRSQKDMRKAIMRGLEPDFDLTSEAWKCDFTELNKIQRSVTTLSDWGITRLGMTKELDRKIAHAKRGFKAALIRLQTGGFEQTEARLQTVQAKFGQINREYAEAKKDWANAEKIKAKKARQYVETKSNSIRRISQCGQRLELEVLPELEDILKSDPKISKWDKAKEAVGELGGKIDWAQRITFILQILSTIPH